MFSYISVYLSLLVLTTLSPAVYGNGTRVTRAPTSSSNCHNVYNYNTFNAGPNKEIKKILLEMKMQLADLQKAVDMVEEIKGNKTIPKGKKKIVFAVLSDLTPSNATLLRRGLFRA